MHDRELPALPEAVTTVPVPVLAPLAPAQVAAEFERLDASAISFENEAFALNTRNAYDRAWKRFEAWCGRRGYAAFPTTPAVLRLYVTALTTEGVPGVDGKPGRPVGASAVEIHLAAIAYAHDVGFPDETNPTKDLSKTFRKGLARTIAVPVVKKRWLPRRQLQDALAELPDSPRGLRDRAMALIAFDSGGRRRSEVVSMRVEHLRRLDDGSWSWTIPRTKTTVGGFEVKIPRRPGDLDTCAALALDRWLGVLQITRGPVFVGIDRRGRMRSNAIQGRHLAKLVKHLATRLGMHEDDFGAHSLRSGFITDMHRAGVKLPDIMKRSGHVSYDVANRYVQAADLYDDDNPVDRALRGL